MAARQISLFACNFTRKRAPTCNSRSDSEDCHEEGPNVAPDFTNDERSGQFIIGNQLNSYYSQVYSYLPGHL